MLLLLPLKMAVFIRRSRRAIIGVLGRRIPAIVRLILMIVTILIPIILVFLLPAFPLQGCIFIRVILASPILLLLRLLLALAHILLSLSVLLLRLLQ